MNINVAISVPGLLAPRAACRFLCFFPETFFDHNRKPIKLKLSGKNTKNLEKHIFISVFVNCFPNRGLRPII